LGGHEAPPPCGHLEASIQPKKFTSGSIDWFAHSFPPLRTRRPSNNNNNDDDDNDNEDKLIRSSSRTSVAAVAAVEVVVDGERAAALRKIFSLSFSFFKEKCLFFCKTQMKDEL
jgi:hypothetical protein